MRMFYQNQLEDGKEMQKEWVILGATGRVLLWQW